MCQPVKLYCCPPAQRDLRDWNLANPWGDRPATLVFRGSPTTDERKLVFESQVRWFPAHEWHTSNCGASFDLLHCCCCCCCCCCRLRTAALYMGWRCTVHACVRAVRAFGWTSCCMSIRRFSGIMSLPTSLPSGAILPGQSKTRELAFSGRVCYKKSAAASDASSQA